MRKLILMLTIVSLFVPSLFAYGQGENGSEETPYEIIWYNIGTPQKDTEMVIGELNKYLVDKINATVKMTYFDWGEYNERMRVIIASGEPYDICFTCSWANDYAQNVARNAFIPLDDLLVEHAQGTLNAVNPAFFSGVKRNGHLYAIPANKEMGWWGVWMFNADIVDKYNLDISNVHTLEDLEPLLAIVKAGEDSDFVPIMGDRTFRPETPEFAAVFNNDYPFVIDFNDTDYKVKNKFETDVIRKHTETIRRYYKAGYFPKDVATLNNTEELRKKKNWFVCGLHSQPYAELQLARSWNTRLYYSQKYDPYVDNSSTQGSMMAVSVTSDRPDKAVQFLNLVNTDVYVRNLLGIGLENTHWEFVNEQKTKVKFLPQSQDYQVPGFTLQNMFITYLFEDDPEDKWQKFEEFNNSCNDSPLLGFFFDITPVKTELAAIQNVKEEFERFIYTGTVDPQEYIAKYNKKLYEAGAQKVMDEMQMQINAWRAAQ